MRSLAGELGITCDISDEGGYWDNRSIEKLSAIIHQHNVLIAAFTGNIKDNIAVQSQILDYPNFEYLEAEGNQSSDL